MYQFKRIWWTKQDYLSASFAGGAAPGQHQLTHSVQAGASKQPKQGGDFAKPHGGGIDRGGLRVRTVPHQIRLSQLSIQFLSGVLARARSGSQPSLIEPAWAGCKNGFSAKFSF